MGINTYWPEVKHLHFLKKNSKTCNYHGLSHGDRHFVCFVYKQFGFHQYISEKYVWENNERYILLRSEDNSCFYLLTSKSTREYSESVETFTCTLFEKFAMESSMGFIPFPQLLSA